MEVLSYDSSSSFGAHFPLAWAPAPNISLRRECGPWPDSLVKISNRFGFGWEKYPRAPNLLLAPHIAVAVRRSLALDTFYIVQPYPGSCFHLVSFRLCPDGRLFFLPDKSCSFWSLRRFVDVNAGFFLSSFGFSSRPRSLRYPTDDAFVIGEILLKVLFTIADKVTATHRLAPYLRTYFSGFNSKNFGVSSLVSSHLPVRDILPSSVFPLQRQQQE